MTVGSGELSYFPVIALKEAGSENTTEISHFQLMQTTPLDVNIKQNDDQSYTIKSKLLRTLFSPTGPFSTANIPENTREDDHWTFPAEQVSVDPYLLSASIRLPRPVELTPRGNHILRPVMEAYSATEYTRQLWLTRWEGQPTTDSLHRTLEDGSQTYTYRTESVYLEYIRLNRPQS